MGKNILCDKTREQVALGVSVVAKCQPCLQYHLRKARNVGVSDAEVEEIIKLARQIRSMADQKMDEFVNATLNNGGETAPSAVDVEGCCPSGEQTLEKTDCCD